LNKPHLLIVENHLDTQLLIKNMLMKDYELSFAETYLEGMHILEDENISLILMDLSLKGEKDGLLLTSVIRKNKKYYKIPIIAVTAHALETDKEKALKAGCSDYLSKPFKKYQLIELINHQIPPK
jgi:CheY-like chemotaxis protein